MSNEVVWLFEYEKESGWWKEMDSKTSGMYEALFQMRKDDTEVFEYVWPDKNDKYQVDFTNMVQKNTVTGKERRLRRFVNNSASSTVCAT